MIAVDTMPLEARSDLAPRFTKLFLSGALPPSLDGLSDVRLVTPESWPRIWKPDTIETARYRWQTLLEQRDPENAHAEKDLELLMNAAENKLAPTLPRAFYRYSSQRNVPAFPCWRTQDCTWRCIDARTKKNIQQTGFSEEQYLQFAHYERFEAVKRWLADLPVEWEARIYAAHWVEDTLAMSWRTFVTHWDSFTGAEYNHVNLVSDTADWFLVFHRDGYALFGCTEHCAREHGMEIDMAKLGSEKAFFEDLHVAYGGEADFFEKTLEKLLKTQRL